METRGMWALAVMAACLLAVQPSPALGQTQQGAVWLDLEGGMEIRAYNDYHLKFADVGLGLRYLLTDWLAVGVGGRLCKTSLTLSGSVTCLLNARPGTQKTIPFVRVGAGTTGIEGAGQMWFGEAGVRYSIRKSIAVSTCLFCGKNFLYRSYHRRYSSVGGLVRLSLQFSGGNQ